MAPARPAIGERRILRAAVLLLTLAIQPGCAADRSGRFGRDHAAAMRDSVARFLDSIPAGLAAIGPTAWLRYFENTPDFFMASDGRIAFAAIDSASAFLDGFAKGVSGMELAWDEVRIEPLAPGLASVGATYRETIADTAGSIVSFSGYMSGVARNTAAGWRLQHLHWSSPVPPVR